MQLIELGKLIKEYGGKGLIYAAKPKNDKFNQINCWIEEINKTLNSKNVIDFIYDILRMIFYLNIFTLKIYLKKLINII